MVTTSRSGLPPKQRRLRFPIQSLLLVSLIVGVFFVAGRSLFDFHYRRGIDNDPLISPVRVLSVQNKSLYLEDGRVVLVHSFAGRLDEIIKASDNLIDIEFEDGTSRVMLYVKSQFAFCGDPFVLFRRVIPPYCIPLIPDDFPLNYRDPVGSGRIVANQGDSAVQERRYH